MTISSIFIRHGLMLNPSYQRGLRLRYLISLNRILKMCKADGITVSMLEISWRSSPSPSSGCVLPVLETWPNVHVSVLMRISKSRLSVLSLRPTRQLKTENGINEIEGLTSILTLVPDLNRWKSHLLLLIGNYQTPPKKKARTSEDDPCLNFKAATNLKVSTLFKYSGVVAATCRHDIPLRLFDIMGTGERLSYAHSLLEDIMQSADCPEKLVPPISEWD
jgi:Kyakuja-Dileera-Zisupton transposase